MNRLYAIKSVIHKIIQAAQLMKRLLTLLLILCCSYTFADKGYLKKGTSITQAIKIAEQNNNPELYFKIGYEFYHGDNAAEKNHKEALKWFLKGVKEHNIDSIYFAGVMYLDGEGTKKNTSRGIELIKLAADKNDIDAQYIFGTSYLFGFNEQKINPEKGLPYLKKAAIAGNSDAAMALTEFYNSDEKYKNIVESYKWAKFAEKYHDTRVLPHLINYSLKFKIDNNAVKKVFLYATLIIWNNKDDKKYIDKVIEIKNKALENYRGNRYKLIEEAVKMAEEWGIKR